MKKNMYIDVRTKSRKRQFMTGKKMAVNKNIASHMQIFTYRDNQYSVMYRPNSTPWSEC